MPPKSNMNTQNNGLEKVAPFKYGYVWYVRFRGCIHTYPFAAF